ncbi:channelopsin 1 [Haematococcus lacustris]|uniref:Channelopsin 1 n=1 Tax=Haematococcus lacustris TaxID=44745 RepID=A0A699Z5H1_HAELA|nr:channelopsin 1 [Haematococcus lacustris]
MGHCTALQFIVFGSCVGALIFYGVAAWRSTCGWEEVYVCVIECMKDDYSKRTMGLLISDIGTIVFGTTAAMSPPGYLKIIFWFCGLCYGMITFYLAAKVYIEAYHTVPKGICRKIVRAMAWDYFGSWCMFPILFVLGPEGFGHISAYGSVIAHQVLDITSKNLWSLMGHMLRVKIHEHIIVHGNITKKTQFTGMITFYLAAKVYIEAYHTVPKGICRKIVRAMAWDYFGSWCMFPILFVLGPEGFGHISAYGSVIAHQVLDITSKNLWSLMGHMLRVKIHEHIIVHGNITKKTQFTVSLSTSHHTAAMCSMGC